MAREQPSAGEVQQIALDDLLLDWANPRFPAEEHDHKRAQEDLVALMDSRYNALAVAQSIARHGFFASEPLIAIIDGDAYRVLEGNRRLAALKALQNPELRARLAEENGGWRRIDGSRLPATVPVVVVDQEASVDALLGFRHISGIDPWSPYQQAQFIAKLVDERGMSLEAVADVVGRPVTEVRSMYRDFDVLRLGRELKVDVKPARDRFGVFTLAMGRPAFRALVDAPAPRDVDPSYEAFDRQKAPALREALGFLFGSPTEERVITDSRQIRDLVAVLEDDSGAALRVLRETRDLDEAMAALGQPDAQFARALALANRHLRRAREIAQKPLTGSSRSELEETRSLVDQILAESGV